MENRTLSLVSHGITTSKESAGYHSARPSLLKNRFFPALILCLFCFYAVSASISLFLKQSKGIAAARYLDEIFFVAFAFWLIITAVLRKRLYASPVYPWLFAFSLVGIFSSVLNRVPANIMLLGFMQIVKPMAVLIVCQSIPLGERGASRTLRGLDRFFNGLTLLAFAYMLIFDIALGSNPTPSVTDRMGERLGVSPMRSFFAHPNTLGNMMVMMSIYHFGGLLLSKSRKRKLLFLMSISCVVLTVRMKAMFLLPWCLALVYFVLRVRRGRIRPTALAIGALMVILFSILVSVLAVSLQDVWVARLSPENSTRMGLLRGAILINIDTYGFGAGFGRYGSPVTVKHFSPLYYEYGIADLPHITPDDPSRVTDQWWAWYLGEVGVWGTAIFVAMLLLTILNLYRMSTRWRERNASLTMIACTAIGALTYGLMIGFAGSFLSGPPTSYYTMSLAGVTYALNRGMYQGIVIEKANIATDAHSEYQT